MTVLDSARHILVEQQIMTGDHGSPAPPPIPSMAMLRQSLSTFVAVAAFAVPVFAPTASAQSESALRQAFEGKTVTVKLDMPGTAKGVDIFPLETTPINYREVADRTKDFSVSLKAGQSAMVTKIVVKKDHIEFQLGGGGYGTFGDETGDAAYVSDAGESKEERKLRDSIKATPGGATKRSLEKELNNLRATRERENARARAEAAQANELRDANIRAKRAQSGSRFNIWYKPTVPSEGMTPAGVMRALQNFVEFGGSPVATNVNPVPTSGASAGTNSNALAAVRKGLLLSEVESLLGPATTASESKEGVLTLMKRNYTYNGQRVMAHFVNGVLIDYAISPL